MFSDHSKVVTFPWGMMKNPTITYLWGDKLCFATHNFGASPCFIGWEIMDNRITCSRRKRKLTVNLVFAAAYLLYSRYYNPYQDKESDIIDTLYTQKKHGDIYCTAKSSALLFHGFSHWKRMGLVAIRREQDRLRHSATYRQARKLSEQAVSASKKVMARVR